MGSLLYQALTASQNTFLLSLKFTASWQDKSDKYDYLCLRMRKQEEKGQKSYPRPPSKLGEKPGIGKLSSFSPLFSPPRGSAVP